MREPFKLEFRETDRGFARADFADFNGDAASIQESSLATEQCVWLGLESGVHHFTGACMARMHLTREMAAELIRALQVFVDTGSLSGLADPSEAES